MPAGICVIWLCVFVGIAAPGAEPPSPSADSSLKKLKDADPEVRVDAVRNLQTSLDPRIPDAMLPLLADEGNSVRRLAARAVGSRWWQIPKDRLADFQAALKRNAASELDDERNMAHRAQGLLARSYQGDMFSRSADKRWVVYERYGLPCLIDTKSETEELLGWSKDDPNWLVCAWGNAPLNDCVSWHAKKPYAAFSMLLGRKFSTIWIWQEGRGLTRISYEGILKAIDLEDGQLAGAAGVYLDPVGWDGDILRCKLSYSQVGKGDEWTDYTAILGWDAKKNSLRLISKKKAAD
jgi:hypothetical protein